MGPENGDKAHTFGQFILSYRKPVAVILIVITVFMAYWAAHVSIATRFEDFFPANHPNVVLYRQYRRQYGGAQTLVLMLRVHDGDIFNMKTLRAIQDITRAIDKLPGVNHNEVFSLASYRLVYAKALPGALVSTPYMYPNLPKDQAEVDDLRKEVLVHRDQVAGYVTRDLKGAMIIASLNDEGFDYKALFDGVQRLIDKYKDSNTTFYATGAAMFSAWGYHYLPRIALIFVISIALMLIILYLGLGRRTGWWAPIVTGICSAIWGLGFMGLMKFNFDPVMLVIPFILTARDLSHGIQWHGRYYDELDRIDGKIEACAATADLMLWPGVLAVLANVAGVVFLATGDIPALKQIGYSGAVWLGASLAMVFVFQPVLMSYLERPQLREVGLLFRSRDPNRRSLYRSLAGWLDRIPVTPGGVRSGLVVVGIVLMVLGVAASRYVRIGYQTQGTPIYRPEAKINRDTAEIGKFVPTDMAWVVLETPNYPSPQTTIGIKTMRMTTDLADYLQSRGDVLAVIGFGDIAEEPMNMLLHNGHPKYMALPDSDVLAANLWGFFFSGAAPDEVYSFFASYPNMTNTSIRVLLPDHTYARLQHLRADIDAFVKDRVANDPSIDKVRVRYIGGDAGLYLASDDVVSRINSVNLGLTLAVILVLCALIFASPVAGVLFVVACVMANAGAFLYMNYRDIGLTTDTIPVISLGIGLGIDYAIYTLARIRDEVRAGARINDAITTGLQTTGGWVFVTFIVMVAGMLPWVFSPLLFHNEMSVLLILLMIANLIVGLLILPAYVAWRRPRFIARYERGARGEQHEAGAPLSRAAR
ncbi:MAG TPA: MMPL family transporter [Candidatus Binataceae bacterium]|nr:MMPL family transporter [Candidatus Binataceae bacterium]